MPIVGLDLNSNSDRDSRAVRVGQPWPIERKDLPPVTEIRLELYGNAQWFSCTVPDGESFDINAQYVLCVIYDKTEPDNEDNIVFIPSEDFQ